MEQEVCVENEPIALGGSGGAVNSVNGMTGDVVLTTSDLANTAGFQDANDVALSIASATSIIDSRLDTVDASIDSITALIPNQASVSNQLADKNFVNSSVSTNTANFVGTFNTVEELEAVQNPTNNDYGFVISTDAAGNVVYSRYKYIASTSTWTFEYALNNSSFTASQWAAIQSGITAALVGQITTNEEAISALRTALLGKQDALTPGANVQIENNVISATDTVYTLPAATASTLGGVKVGDGLSVEEDGTLSATGGGGPTVLTSADYNYPANNPTAIALWLLDDGVYEAGETGIVVRSSGVSTIGVNFVGQKFVVMTGFDGTKYINAFVNGYTYCYVTTSSGSAINANGYFLDSTRVRNNLTTTQSGYILDARQGEALNDKIGGDLSNLDTTDKTSLIAAINELVARVAALEGNA